MQTILFNRSTNFVVGIDREQGCFEYSVKLPYPITLSKQIQIPTNQLIQKTNSENQPLFKENIIIDEITGEESYTETITSQKVIKYETVENTYKIVVGEETVEQINEFGETVLVPVPIYEEITTVSQNPVEWENLEPILIQEIITKTITFPEQYMEFDYEEILEAKKQSINNNNLLKIVAFDEDFLDSSLNLSGISIGDGVLILHGNNAELITPPISLPKITSMFQLYLESQPDITISISGDNGLIFVDFDSKNKAKLPIPSDQVILKFTNTSTNNREIYCYGLLA